MKKLLFILIGLCAFYSCSTDSEIIIDTEQQKSLKSAGSIEIVYNQYGYITIYWEKPFCEGSCAYNGCDDNSHKVVKVSLGSLSRMANSFSGSESFSINGSNLTTFKATIYSGAGKTISEQITIHPDGSASTKCKHNYSDISRNGMYSYRNNYQNLEFNYPYDGWNTYEMIIMWKDARGLTTGAYWDCSPVDVSQLKHVQNSILRIDNSLSYYLSTVSTPVPSQLLPMNYYLKAGQLEIPIRLYDVSCSVSPMDYYNKKDYTKCTHYLEGVIHYPFAEPGRYFEFSKERKQ